MSAPATHPCSECKGTGQAHEHTFQCFESMCSAGGPCRCCNGKGTLPDRASEILSATIEWLKSLEGSSD